MKNPCPYSARSTGHLFFFVLNYFCLVTVHQARQRAKKPHHKYNSSLWRHGRSIWTAPYRYGGVFPHSLIKLPSYLTVEQMAYLPLSLNREQSDGLRFKQLLSTLHDSALGIQHYSRPEQYSSIETFREAFEQTGNAIASLLATNQQQYEEIKRLQMINKETEAAELRKKLAQVNEELTMWRRAGTLRCRSKPCQEVFMTVSPSGGWIMLSADESSSKL